MIVARNDQAADLAVAVSAQSTGGHQMFHLVPAPTVVAEVWWPRRRVARLDHLFDHPDDPTGFVWIRLDRRGIQRERARSDWTGLDRRRAPGYGSGGLRV
jgi:hypothetical protein